MTNPHSLYLVSCVSKKRDQPCAAGQLYQSSWFTKARAHVLAQSAPWYILSAEHGLIHPDQVIAPYERTLNTMAVAERRAWAERVKAQIQQQGLQPQRFVVLAGQRYREYLLDFLATRATSVEVPMQGLTIGKQLQWFDRAKGRH